MDSGKCFGQEIAIANVNSGSFSNRTDSDINAVSRFMDLDTAFFLRRLALTIFLF